MPLFSPQFMKRKEQKSALQIFLKDVTEKKNWKFINAIDSPEYFLNTQKIELLKIKSSHKLPSKQNLPSKTHTFDNSNYHCLQQICVSS